LSAKILAVPVAAPDTAPAAKRPYLPNGTKHIAPCQADNLVEAARFARTGLGAMPNVHCTIMWNGTDAGADTDGHRFAKVREGLSKALGRRGIQFTAVWAREARELHMGEHAHMVFHLPSKWRKHERFAEIERVIERLVARHGGELYGDWTVDLRQHRNGDVRYLLKGGPPEVWHKYRLKRDFPKSQSIIFGKRCGTTENIGQQARECDGGSDTMLLAV